MMGRFRMGWFRLVSRAVLAGAIALGACAKGDADVDGGPGTDGDGGGGVDAPGGPRPDAPPSGTEICDGVDNDGDQFVDEGELCVGAPNATGRCNGMLGCVVDTCTSGFFDIDGVYDNGCECTADPLETGTDDCTAARDLGDLTDSAAAALEVIGNVVPETDADWYRFRAVDAADAACDAFHVRVLFLDNPDDQYAVDVWRGGCGATQVCAAGTDMQWYTNFLNGMVGQCPCGPTSTNHCDDETSEFHVRVARKPGAPLTCANYRLEVSNGKYPAP
jgi:hypothetical protein